MDNCIGLISTDVKDINFGDICKPRPSYMLPVGGRYRLIDFAISHMVNYGISTVALYTGPKIRSAMDHLGNGKSWDLNRRFSGLYIFPPSNEEMYSSFRGNISEYYSTERFFDRVSEEYLFLMDPSIIAKVNLNKVSRYFKDTDADMTLVYKRESDPSGKRINSHKLYLDQDGNLEGVGINLGIEEEFNHFLGMIFIKKKVFLEIVKDAIEKGNANTFKDAIANNISKYKINSYEFKGNVETVSNLKEYYDTNMALLKRDVSKEIFFEGGAIETKSKDEPSTLYKESSKVENSLIANGCRIEGEVENSIIFRGVTIGKGAIVRNSIIMQKTIVEEGAIVVNSILDKYTVIKNGARITGSPGLPYVVEKYSEIDNG